ncbi:MAG: methionyl-tRNA formyltransferase [Patescibacteria group bacterium]|nr:methionyl-tRNA formyltransferase [Patescibacteria group bacterium]
MRKTAKTLIFFGTPEFATPSLKALQKKFKVFQPKNITEIPANTDIAVVAAYGHIIPKKILEIPKFGFLNIHPSLLPKYRGPSPIQNAILNGDKETGVSIMLLDKKMDSGPILAQKKVKINENETYETLRNRLAEIGAKLLIKTLLDYVSGKIKPKPQNHKKATYTKLLKREDGKIDWSKPAEEIERMVRAYHPWPGTWTELNGKRLKIILNRVQLEGKKEMSLDEFLRGYVKN